MKHNWEYKRLGDVCEILDSRRKPVTKSNRKPGPYPYYGASGIQDFVADYIFDGDYLLVGEDGAKWGANEKSAFSISGKTWVNNHAHILDFKKSPVSQKLVEYILCALDLNKIITGAVVPKLTQKNLITIIIPVPPMATQEQIVAELDQINDLIAKNRELLSQLDALAQSLFYDTFGDPISNPKRWIAKRFKDILCKIGSGATPRGGKQAYQGGEVSLIRSLNVYNTYFKYDELAKINDEQAYELRNVEVFNNDVLLNITGASVARCFIVPVDTLPARVNQHVAILRPNNKYIQSIYLHRLLITPAFQNYLIGTARGKSATREALPKATLEKIEIPVPPLTLQEDFAAKVEAIEGQKAKVEAEIAELQTLLDARMDYWFND